MEPGKRSLVLSKLTEEGNIASDSTGRALVPLFGKLTGRAQGAVSQFGGGRVKTPGLFNVTEQPLSHHPLNPRHTHMSEPLVPMEDFLFFMGQVNV